MAGLCNRSTGIVEEIVYNINYPPPHLPELILINFEQKYTGPSPPAQTPSRSKWFPIYQKTAMWYTPTWVLGSYNTHT